MTESEAAPTLAIQQELRQRRQELMRYLSGLPAGGSVIELQHMLVEEHGRPSHAAAERDLERTARILDEAALADLDAAQLTAIAGLLRTNSRLLREVEPGTFKGDVLFFRARFGRAGDVPVGRIVVSWLISGDRDERQFPTPDRFDLSRPSKAHLTMDHGIHICLCAHGGGHRAEGGAGCGLCRDSITTTPHNHSSQHMTEYSAAHPRLLGQRRRLNARRTAGPGPG